MNINLAASAQVASFIGPGLQGNQHVVLLDVFSERTRCLLTGRNAAFASRVLELSGSIETIIVFVASGSSGFARFFQGGREIRRCGSGSLAAAQLLSTRSDTTFPHRLLTPAGAITLGKQGRLFFFDMEVLPLELKTSLRIWQCCINRPVSRAMLVGGEADYVILELGNAKAVAGCRLHTQQLLRMSRRAVIVTAPGHRRGIDYVLRYFAPQYGQREDAATGSAHAMVAPYWQKRLGCDQVRGLQLSKAGGLFKVVRSGMKQRVMGAACATEIDLHYRRLIADYFREL